VLFIRWRFEAASVGGLFFIDARALSLALIRPGWLNLAAVECPSISAVARLAAWRWWLRFAGVLLAEGEGIRTPDTVRTVYRTEMRLP
jgi:hypothetical protein